MKKQTTSTPNQNPQSRNPDTPAAASNTTPHEAPPSEPFVIRREPALSSSNGSLENSPPIHPRRLRPEPVEEFSEELADAIYDEVRFYGHSDAAAAAKHGVSAATVAQWKFDDEKFALDLEAARAELKERLIEEVGTATKRDGSEDWRARAWLLERIFPNDFGRGKRRKQREPKQLDPNDPIILTPERLEYLRQRREAALRADAHAGQSDAEQRAGALFREWKRGYLANLASGGPVDLTPPEWIEESPDLWWLHPVHPAPVLKSAAAENPILYPEHVRREWDSAEDLRHPYAAATDQASTGE